MDQRRSERIAYEHMLREFRGAGDRRMAKRLEASPVLSPGYFAIRDTVMHRLGGGTMREIP